MKILKKWLFSYLFNIKNNGGIWHSLSNALTLLVGITSYVVGSCGSLGVVDGFARVAYQMDWIRENSDNYVKFCSAKITPQNICSVNEDCKNDHEVCFNGQCSCKLGYSKEKAGGNCVDECTQMQEFNQCSNGVFKVEPLTLSDMNILSSYLC